MNSTCREARAGCFYAIGVGPGSPDLITLRALNILKTAEIIIAPRSEVSESSLALDIVREHLAGKDVRERVYPMKRDSQATHAFWREVALESAELCRQGKSVAQITLGDPLVYSTSSYMLPVITEAIGQDKVEVVPGITAFQAAAARFQMPLSLQEDRVTFMTADDMGAIEAALACCETLILYKIGKRLPQLTELLKRKNLLDSARLAFAVEQAGREYLVHNLCEVNPEAPGYMSCMIIRAAHRAWNAEHRTQDIKAAAK